MPFDFKKEYRECYMPKDRPEFVTAKPARYIAVREKGSPNEEGGEYQRGVGILYAVVYTIEMSYKGPYKVDDFFKYMVPPLEGFWWRDGVDGADYSDKDDFDWISVTRLSDFVKKGNFDWVVKKAERKKELDRSLAECLTIDKGLYVQIVHHGAYDEEPVTVTRVDGYIAVSGYENGLSATRLHHEIYLSDPRKTKISRRRAVIRHPAKMGAGGTPRVHIERQEDVRRRGLMRQR